MDYAEIEMTRLRPWSFAAYMARSALAMMPSLLSVGRLEDHDEFVPTQTRHQVNDRTMPWILRAHDTRLSSPAR
jgi:hypothetical protein